MKYLLILCVTHLFTHCFSAATEPHRRVLKKSSFALKGLSEIFMIILRNQHADHLAADEIAAFTGDFKSINSYGETALHFTAVNNMPLTCKALLARCPELLNAKNPSGQTALELAIENKADGAVAVLSEAK